MKYDDLIFGTAGIRSQMGSKKGMLNVEAIRAIAFAHAKMLKSKGICGRAAVCYDSRNNSALFAKEAAMVLAGCGFEVYLSKEAAPTPFLSFVIRRMECCTGVNITASHNTAEYNGYKVYGANGAQMGAEESVLIQENLCRLDVVETASAWPVKEIPHTLLEEYTDSVVSSSSEIAVDYSRINVVYTPHLYAAAWHGGRYYAMCAQSCRR